MAERTDQRTRDSDVSVDVDTDFSSVLDDDTTASSPPASSSQKSSQGLASRIGARVGGFFAVRTFGIALLVTVALAFVVGTFVPLPGAALLGVFLGGFLLGLGSDERSYLEVGTATLFSGAVTALLSNLLVSLAGFGVPIVALGAGASGLAGVLGHYFGRDLRAGVTKDV